jgi:hypothetical protein
MFSGTIGADADGTVFAARHANGGELAEQPAHVDALRFRG